MFRMDYAPNRFVAAKKALLAFVQTRLKSEAATQAAIVTFGNKVKRVREFTTQYDDIEEGLRNLDVGGKSPLGDALGTAVQMLIGEMRKAGARIPRILLISDGKSSKTSIDPVTIAKLCAGLNIYIDVIRLGAVEHFNILKRLTQMTNGQFFYCNDAADMVATAIKLAEHPAAAKSVFDKDDAKFAPLLAQIAGNLVSPTDMSPDQKTIIQNILGKNADKCAICFSTNDPVTKAPFNVSGRYCPNCNSPMHISCCAMWAEQDTKRTSKEIFRCPHCFYLLKIPGEVSKARMLHKQMKSTESAAAPSSDGERVVPTKKAMAKDLGDAAMFSACPVCHNIFEEDDQVVACGNEDCNAIYHTNCFTKLEKMRCRKCGFKLKS